MIIPTYVRAFLYIGVITVGIYTLYSFLSLCFGKSLEVVIFI